MSYTISDKVFKTKTEALTYFKKILNSYSVLDFLPTELNKDFEDLLSYHEFGEQKVGKGIYKIQIVNTVYQNRGFLIHRIDGTTTDFSYIKCLMHPSLNNKIYSACRHAIYGDIQDMKDGMSCIAHHDVMPFKQLVDEWKKGIVVVEDDINKTQDNSVETFFTKQFLINSFKEFHNKNAKVVLLSVEEHKSKHAGRKYIS